MRAASCSRTRLLSVKLPPFGSLATALRARRSSRCSWTFMRLEVLKQVGIAWVFVRHSRGASSCELLWWLL